jgi:hypothetical protein
MEATIMKVLIQLLVAGVMALGLPVNALAQGKTIGSFLVDEMTTGEGVFAATVNDSLAVLGQYCYLEQGSCLWLLATDIDCKSGSRYPVLVNADGGAFTTEIVCYKLGEKPRYAFTNFDLIDSAVKKSEKIGIAFPMQSGNFQVNRFLLNGVTPALNLLGEKFEKKSKTTAKPNTSTRNLTL